MLIFAVAVVTLSLCDAYYKKEVGGYSKFILKTRYSIPHIFHDELHRRDLNFVQKIEYLKEHRRLLQAQQWVMDGFLPYDSNNNLLRDCVSTSGEEINFDLYEVEPHFKQQLRTKWPRYVIDGTEEGLWQLQYREGGSCVTENATDYFVTALEHFDDYDMRTMLGSVGIVPGGDYRASFIAARAFEAFNKRVLVECLHPVYKDTEQQYLLRILLCYNTNHELIDCPEGIRDSQIYNCNADKLVNYPLLPQGHY